MPSIPLLSSLVKMFTWLPQKVFDARRFVADRVSKLVCGVRSSATTVPATATVLRSLEPMTMGAQVTQVGSVRSHCGADGGSGLRYEMERRNRVRSACVEMPADKQFSEYFSPYYAVPERENSAWIIVTAEKSRIMIDAQYAALFGAAARRADNVIAGTVEVQESANGVTEGTVLPRWVLQLPTERFVLPRAKLMDPRARSSIKSDYSPRKPEGKRVRFLNLEPAHERHRPRNVN